MRQEAATIGGAIRGVYWADEIAIAAAGGVIRMLWRGRRTFISIVYDRSAVCFSHPIKFSLPSLAFRVPFRCTLALPCSTPSSINIHEKSMLVLKKCNYARKVPDINLMTDLSTVAFQAIIVKREWGGSLLFCGSLFLDHFYLRMPPGETRGAIEKAMRLSSSRHGFA